MYTIISRVMALVTLSVFFCTSVVGAAPLPNSELKALHNYPYYSNEKAGDSSCSPSNEANGGAVEVGEEAKTAFLYFTSKDVGYTAEQAAGLVGNFIAESGLDPKIQNGIGAYGIAQWLGGRLTNMRAWVSGQGKDPTSLTGQLSFVVQELNTAENAAKQDLLKQKTPADAARSVMDKYERPGNDGSLPKRVSNAQSVYDKYKDLAETAASDQITASDLTTAACQNTSSPDCLAAVDNEKILCEAKKYDGIYYRWGGGHQGYAAFKAGCPDPSAATNNTPSGSANDSTNGGVSGNPSACATDCSGLVSVAVSAAFGIDKTWTSASVLSDPANWQKVSLEEIKPGDVVTHPGHIEIVDHYLGNGKVMTFGSHETGSKTSNVTTDLGNWTAAHRYVGPKG